MGYKFLDITTAGRREGHYRRRDTMGYNCLDIPADRKEGGQNTTSGDITARYL